MLLNHQNICALSKISFIYIAQNCSCLILQIAADGSLVLGFYLFFENKTQQVKRKIDRRRGEEVKQEGEKRGGLREEKGSWRGRGLPIAFIVPFPGILPPSSLHTDRYLASLFSTAFGSSSSKAAAPAFQ